MYLTVGNIKFRCPYCKEKHSDDDENILRRCNRNKIGFARLNCRGCGERFGVTYDYRGDAVAFKLKNAFVG